MSGEWSKALDAQLALRRWWLSDMGMAYGAFMHARYNPGSSPDAPTPNEVYTYALAAQKSGKASGDLVDLSAEGIGVVRVNHSKALKSWPRFKDHLEGGFTLAHDVAACIDDATTYWVSPEMGRFLHHAHQDIPPHNLAVTDLPAHRGFIYFEEPLEFEGTDGEPWSIRVLKWDYYDGKGQSVDITAYRDGEPPAPRLIMVRMGSWWEGTKAEETVDKLLQAFWILSQQRIALAERRPIERHLRRRLQRARFRVPEDGIMVVTLRRPESPSGKGNSKLVDWSHRWIVSGHWRNQWYPSIEDHRPKWIDAYEKGPDKKPLVLKDRVYRWVQ